MVTTDKGLKALSAEMQLMIWCSQVDINEQQSAGISGLLKKDLDWELIFQVAERNKVLSLLCWNIIEKFSESISEERLQSLQQFMQVHTHHNVYLTQKLLKTLKILKNSGIPALPFKGATLAMRAYQNLALRQYIDLDILVQPKDFDASVALLKENGYSPVTEAGWLKRKALFFTRKKDIAMISPDNRTCVELHWKLSGSHFALPYEVNELWGRLEKFKLGGSDLEVLGFNDLFVYLCLHGSRHGWERLSWICDLRELIHTMIRQNTKVDWKQINLHAKDHGCERVVELGLVLIECFYGERFDYPDYARIEAESVYREIADEVRVKILAEEFKSSEISHWYGLHLRLKERNVDKFKVNLVYLAWYSRLIFKPNAVDISIFHLPRMFYPLYFLMRPIRLLRNYFATARSKSE